MLLVAAVLVLLNAFFVAAEFALVKVRVSRLEELVAQRRPFARTALWLARRLDRSLSACQLGITIASLALGWVGEPAFAHLLEPLFHALSIESPRVIHATSFIVAFSIITSAHLVLGEQAPKIFAIRRPEVMTLWCAPLLRLFYVLFFPLLVALDGATRFLLRRVGVDAATGHEQPHSEPEIRALLSSAHAHGEITPTEATLLDAVFEFDDTVVRRMMVPRTGIQAIDAGASLADALDIIRRTRHTRYPLADPDLEHCPGVVHVKDLLGLAPDDALDLRAVARPAPVVPETMRLADLLRRFQQARSHLALVVDEHATVVGMITLENVLERIVGPVQDEFDDEPEPVTRRPDGSFLVQGGARLDEVNLATGLDLDDPDVDTISGLIVRRIGRVPRAGRDVELPGARAHIIDADRTRITRLRITRTPGDPE